MGDFGGFTALMYAASYLRVGIAEALVAAGADLKATDNAGRNITHFAKDQQIKAAIDRGLKTRGLPPMTQYMDPKYSPESSKPAQQQTKPQEAQPVQQQQPVQPVQQQPVQ